MTALGRRVVAAAAALLLHAAAGAVPLYLQFSGDSASGSLNGTAFGGATWSFEVAVETTTPDSDRSRRGGEYRGAITGAWVGLNGNGYRLAGDAAAGDVSLSSFVGSYDAVSILPTSGGQLQFATRQATTFPALFDSVNDLASANLGTTVRDTTTDRRGTSSFVDFGQSGLLLDGGGLLTLYATSAPASGRFSVTVSDRSMVPPPVTPVPEPGTLLLASIGIAALVLARRREPKG